METNNRQREILKELNDNRSKLSALFSLYNNSLIIAEENRTSLMNYFEQLLDFKNDLNTLTNAISSVSKTERANEFLKIQPKIKKMDKDLSTVYEEFQTCTKKYRLALQECGSLKTEYKHEVSELCKEFKQEMNDDTPQIVVKGYKQQVKIIKTILDRIEMLISDYNIKKNKVEQDVERFTALYDSVNLLISRLKTSA